MKKALSLLMALVCITSCIPKFDLGVHAMEYPDSVNATYGSSGSCGEHTTYVLDEYGILTISGYGAIDRYAFYKNMDILEIVIGDGITSIGDYAFEGCKNVLALYMGYDVEVIGRNCFYQCNFENVTLPPSVREIGSTAFYDCKMLKSINIPEGVTEIKDDTFTACSNLKSIKLPSTLKSIGTLAFNGCWSMTSFDLPYGLESIGSHAFGNCTELKSFVVPDSVTFLGGSVFYNCQKLENLKLSSNLEFVGERLIEDVPYYDYCYENDMPIIIDNVFIDIGNVNGDVVIPNGITVLASDAFSNHSTITSVELPSSLRFINNACFSGCTLLSSINLHDKIEGIGPYAFKDCSALKEVSIPKGIDVICVDTFENCSSLESIVIPKNVTSVEHGAFYNCTGIKNLTFENKVDLHKEEFGYSEHERPFEGCTGIETITIPSVFSFNPDIEFIDSTNLKRYEVTIADDDDNYSYSYRSIDGVLFAKDNSLIKYPYGKKSDIYAVPEACRYIEFRAFEDSKFIKNIVLPDNILYLTPAMFNGCTSLESITSYNHYLHISGDDKLISDDEPNSFTGTIYGYDTSGLGDYANKHGYKFVPLDDAIKYPDVPDRESTKIYEPGDPNGDGSVDILDVILVNKVIFGKVSITKEQLKAIDFNHNGMPDAEESLLIMKYLVGLVDKLEF